jgi:hypothetical protein
MDGGIGGAQSPPRTTVFAREKGKRQNGTSPASLGGTDHGPVEGAQNLMGVETQTGKTAEPKADRDKRIKRERKAAFASTWEELKDGYKHLQSVETPHEELPPCLREMLGTKITVRNNHATWGYAGVDRGSKLTIVGFYRPADLSGIRAMEYIPKWPRRICSLQFSATIW